MTLAALLVSVGVGAFGAPDALVPAPVPIAGTVVDADRRPVGGVGVFFSDFKGRSGNGEIVGRAETDARGRFRLEVPGSPGGGPEPGVLWAYRPGSLVASYPVNRETLPPDWPVSMVIDAPARAEFLVRGPDGRPVAGARIQPVAVHGPPYNLPEGLGERIAERTVTDARGRAVLTAFFPDEISIVTVSAPGLGRQRFPFESFPGSRKPRVIELSPVGRVEGRIVSDDPAFVRNRKLLAVVSDSRRGLSAVGLESLTTDEQGRFTIPEAPVGDLSISGNPLPGSPWFLMLLKGSWVEAGRTTEVEVKPIAGVRLSGTVRERGTGAPIAGAGVWLDRMGQDDPGAVRTDGEGRYTLFGGAGRRPPIRISPPEGFASPRSGPALPRVLRGVEAVNLPPIGLSRARTVVGVVVDDRGEPVPGATVLVSYSDGGIFRTASSQERRVIAGHRGEFRLHDVIADAPLDLSAVAPDGRRTARSVESKPGAEPARLVVTASGAVSLAGRVVNTSGRRVVGARVHIRLQERYPNGQFKSDVLVEIRGAYTIKTRDDGWFRTPPVLEPDQLYAALVEADGYDLARTIWTGGSARTFPELVLRPRSEPGLAVVEGSVRDRGGRPVAGAAVWIATDAGPPLRAATDAQGRFRLEGLPPARSFLFVEAVGFRFFGRVLDPAAGSVSIALTRTDERPTGSMTTLPPPRPRAEERALSHRLIVPYIERVLKDGAGVGGWRSRALDALAYSDPARVLAIAGGEAAGAHLRRLACARAIWERDRAGAQAVIEAMPDGEWRIRGHLQASRAIPAAERQARLDQLEQALERARTIADGDSRVRWLGQIGGRYLDLGDVEKGTKLLRENVPAARALPKTGTGGFARGSFAAGLAHVDPDAALELIEGVDRTAILVYRIDVINAIAAIDPARAESLLPTIEGRDAVANNLPALCHAMARKDPARARRLADRGAVDPPVTRSRALNRAYAIGMIALALADSDRAQAAHFLDEAFAALKPLADEGPRGFQETQDAPTIAAALLPVAERIDPALVPEFFWRAVSLRAPSRSRAIAGALRDATRDARPAAIRAQQTRDASMRDATLALLLARYDRDAAMVLLAPLLDRWLLGNDDTVTMARALAAVDPERAVALVESMLDEPGGDPRGAPSFKDYARIEVADFLARPPAERWDRVARLLLELWVVED